LEEEVKKSHHSTGT